MTAREFAIKAHGDQKYGEHPYVYHLDEVAAVLREFGVTSQGLQEAAYLHDVLEETPKAYHMDSMVWFPSSEGYVWCVTGIGNSRQERNASAYFKIAGNKPATRLKLADRIANVRACIRFNDERRLKMYRDEYPGFRAALWREWDAEAMWACLEGLMTVKS